MKPPLDNVAAGVLALARRVGLKGFEDPPAAKTPEAPLAKDDASEVVNLARRMGLKGFE